jgi:hypothetical protein
LTSPRLSSTSTTSAGGGGIVNGGGGSSSSPATTAASYDIMRNFEQQQRITFFKQSKRQFPMFPYTEEKSRVKSSLFIKLFSNSDK